LYSEDHAHYINGKELLYPYDTLSSLFYRIYAAANVMLHEDSTVVLATLTKLTIRFLIMITDLRRLRHMPKTHDIGTRPRYIRSAANT
jgi:hypothetical protein